MKQEKIKQIGAVIILLILAIMFTLIALRQLGRVLYKLNIKNSLVIFLSNNEMKEEKINVNWKEKYPEELYKEENTVNNKKIDSIIKKIKGIETKIEKNTSEWLIGYERFLEASYVYDNSIAYTLVSNSNPNSRVKLKDYWCRIGEKVDISSEANNLKNFNEYLKDKNINLLYVQAPGKIEKDNKNISKIYSNNLNDNADKLLDIISNEVDYLDLRESIKLNNKDYLELFFKTDHHWKPEAGIWATGEIIDVLNSKYNYSINKELIANIENYNIDICENAYLGSDGRYVTLANTSLEDISIITPKFETNLIVKIPDKEPYKEGTFKEVLMDYTKLNVSYEYRTTHYGIYGYGDRAMIEIENKKIVDNKKVLIIKDSFANVVTPYLALGIKNCSIIDLRHFTGSVKKYIDEYNPDTIIILYYVGSTENGIMWEFK